MATSTNERKDEVVLHMNDEVVSGAVPDVEGYDNLDPVSKRPAKSADLPAWVDYCVDLGASRDYLENDTEHIGNRTKLTVMANDDGEMVSVELPLADVHPALTKAQLIELADSLGG